MSMNYNHIYPYTFEQFNLKIEPYFKNLEKQILSNIKPTNKHVKFFLHAHIKIKQIMNKKSSWTEKNHEWQNYVISLKETPDNFNFPLVIK